MLPSPRHIVNRVAENPLSCSIGEPAFPSRPGAAGAAGRSGGDWEERSHPEPRAARPFARAWRALGREERTKAPDLPRSEHRGTLRTSWRIRLSPLPSTYKRWTERLRRVVSDRAIGVVGWLVYPFDPAGMRRPVDRSTKGDHHVAITCANDRGHDPGRP